MKDLRFWSSIMKQKSQINNIVGTHLNWKKCEWMLIGLVTTLKEERMFVLVEYCESAYPKTGLFQIVVTEEELNEYFYEYRKEIK